MQTYPHIPTVSILILNWNGAKILSRCLEAVTAQTYKDFEVVVVDNASSDGSADGLEMQWPGIRVLQLKENLKFCEGNNIGVKETRGNWLALLNNDAFPDPYWLENLMEATRNFPQFSFFSSRFMQPETQTLKLTAGTGDLYHFSGLAWPRDLNQPIQHAHLDAGEVFSACAAAALYKRDVFLAAGGFDEDYVSHHEDVDLGFRLRLQGHRCLYVSNAVVQHVGSASFGLESEVVVYQVQRNMVWTYFKNMPGWLFWKYLPAHLFVNLFFFLYYIQRGQPKAVYRAKRDALRSLPKVLKKRRKIQVERKINPSDLDRQIIHAWLSPFLLGKRTGWLKNYIEGSNVFNRGNKK